MLATNKKYRIVSVRKNINVNRKHFVAVQLRYEYWDYIDEYRYCIYTRLPKEVFLKKYGEEAKRYEPYILLDWECYKARVDFVRNEWKFEKRRQRNESLYAYEDGETERYNPRLMTGDTCEKLLVILDNRRLMEALEQLTPTQKRRIMAHYFEGKSSRVIAKEEGVNYSKVDKSIKAALKKLLKTLK